MVWSGFSGFSSFWKWIFSFLLFSRRVFVNILRISLNFEGFWTLPSLAKLHFLCILLIFFSFIEFPQSRETNFRVPEIWHKKSSVDHGPKTICPPFGWENLPPWLHWGLFWKISYNILPLVQVLVHKDTEAQKLRGRAVAGENHAIPTKNFFFGPGHFATLRNFCQALSGD